MGLPVNHFRRRCFAKKPHHIPYTQASNGFLVALLSPSSHDQQLEIISFFCKLARCCQKGKQAFQPEIPCGKKYFHFLGVFLISRLKFFCINSIINNIYSVVF